jgi:hypothetical protein
MKIQPTTIYEHSKGCAKGKVCSYKPTLKNKDHSNKQTNDASLASRKTRTNQTQNQQTERNNKDQT